MSALIARLTPIPNVKMPESFSASVALVTRPYLKLSLDEMDLILKMKHKCDVYMMDGKVPVTFGNADGGYALMPLNDDGIRQLGIKMPKTQEFINDNWLDTSNKMIEDIMDDHDKLAKMAPELLACLKDVLDADGDLDAMDFERYRKAVNLATNAPAPKANIPK